MSGSLGNHRTRFQRSDGGTWLGVCLPVGEVTRHPACGFGGARAEIALSYSQKWINCISPPSPSTPSTWKRCQNDNV